MPIILAILSSFFFAITFVVNQLISNNGGDWLWTSSLRYLIMLPLFLIILFLQKQSLKAIMTKIKSQKKEWILWSQIGFGLFYLPLTLASTFAPGWLIASTWQITIVAGSVMAPYLYKSYNSKFSKYDVLSFGMILFGVFFVELGHFTMNNWFDNIVALLLVLVAAFAYPLGNRKIMEINSIGVSLPTTSRILAMLICSLPTWIIAAIIALFRSGFPSNSQIISSAIVALFSGVIATFLFFKATQMAIKNLKLLATIEATQSMEVLFSFFLGMAFLGDRFPSISVLIGLSLILFGMTLKVRT